MHEEGTRHSKYGVENHGIYNVEAVHWNLTTPALYEQVVRRREGIMAHLGPIVVRTGVHTGRSPNDKFIIREPASEGEIWWGEINRPFSQEKFNALYNKMTAYLQGKEIFVQDCFTGADPAHRLPIRIITEDAWQSLFARNMFIIPTKEELERHVPEFTLIAAPSFRAIPEIDDTNSDAFILIDFGRKAILIGGTSYAGEIKKAVFTVMNYLLPDKGVLPMHSSANVGEKGDIAIFFGLSGTGKTTLSADPERRLIGDDEHGWSERGVFNFEGGCYAKVIHLSPAGEPQIYATTRRFGTILENVGIDVATRRVDLNDNSLTENTRASYPLGYIDNAILKGMAAGQPANIVMLTADAFGVLPPIAHLTPEQAMYYFLSGYTAKVAGTETGITEPQATFSACFGAPFMARHPNVYAEMLGEKVRRHHTAVWLVNTGWSGGPYGVGKRMKLAYTRAMVKAALSGHLNKVPTVNDRIFGFQVPTFCPNVPAQVLSPRNTWQDKDAYDKMAKHLAQLFHENFQQFAGEASAAVRNAGPKVG